MNKMNSSLCLYIVSLKFMILYFTTLKYSDYFLSLTTSSGTNFILKHTLIHLQSTDYFTF